MTALSTEEDAFGAALADHFAGREVADLILEIADGRKLAAMHPSEFFKPPDECAREERDVLDHVSFGPVLDLGAGAGRHALYFQKRFDVTAVDISPGAIDVCRARGVADARLQDLNEPPVSRRRWGAVLMMCGNFGLAGTRASTRELEGTGWALEKHLIAAADQYIVLRKEKAPPL